MEKWHGSFAQTQLEKFGWEKGEGLGKTKSGNVKHINVTVKNDKKGVGVNQGQWEFAWWDHLYNKSANSVVVAKDEEKGEIKVQTKAKGETRRSRTGIISTQKPTGKSIKEAAAPSTMSSMADERNMMDSVEDIHMSMAKKVASASLYGAFVKSATSVDISNTNSPASSTPDDSEDDELKDYSIKISDADLFAACEGRTARKGGRGLVDQKGKFKRVMKEYLRPDEEEDSKKDTKDEKKKKKKRKHTDDEDEKESKKLKKEKMDKKDKKDKKEKKEKKDKKEKKEKKDKKEKKEKKSKA